MALNEKLCKVSEFAVDLEVRDDETVLRYTGNNVV